MKVHGQLVLCLLQDEIGRCRREKEEVTADKEAAVEQGKEGVC